MTRPLLTNRDARRLFLHRHALSEAAGPATGDDLLGADRGGWASCRSIRSIPSPAPTT